MLKAWPNMQEPNLNHNFLSEPQIQKLVNDVTAYIQEQRQKYVNSAKPLTPSEINHFKNFFPPPILGMAKFINVDSENMENPFFCHN